MTRIEFSKKTRDQAAQRAAGKCQCCGLPFGGKPMRFDHILPAALGGEATLANCQVLCEPCHKAKTGTRDVPTIRKADRQRRAHFGIKNAKGRKLAGGGFQKVEKTHAIDKSVFQKLPPRRLYEDIQ